MGDVALRVPGSLLGFVLRTVAAVLLVISTTRLAPANARSGDPSAVPKTALITAGETFVRALGNSDISYTTIRTSIFWAEDGQTRALLARVFKDGDRVRYEYPARGNHPARVVIETDDTLCVYDPSTRKVVSAHRAHDPDVDGIRVKLALANYTWRFESSNSPRRRVVAAYRPGAKHPTQRFWIAIAPMVVVRSERYGPHGELRSSWALESLHVVESVPDRYFEPPHEPDLEVRDAVLPEHVRLQDVQARAGFQPVQLPEDKVPEGYRVVDIAIERTSAGRSAVRLVYSDGLDSFSLLEAPRRHGHLEKIKAASALDVNILDTTAQVFTSAEANLVHWQDRQRLYTLIGPQSSRTLVELSRGLIATTGKQRTRPVLQGSASSPVAIPESPRRRSFGELIARGWARLMRLFGIG